MKRLTYTYLQYSLPQEDHLLPSFLHDEILDEVPLFAVAPTTADSDMNLPYRVLFVAGGTGYGFVGDVSDEVVYRTWMRRWRIQICQRL
jgi:hypothetical protein